MTKPIRWGEEFRVNTTTFSTQDQPVIAALASGRFVAVWRDISQSGGDTSSQAVRAQVFNADGSKSGNELLVNTVTKDEQWNPAVAGLPDDRFLVAFQDNSRTGGDTSQSAIRAQFYSGTGAPIGAEFLVNTSTDNAQNNPKAAAGPGGQSIITWIDFSGVGDNAPAGVKAQLFNPNGSRLGGEFLVNSTTAGNQVYPAAAVLSDGTFVVAWTDSSKANVDTSSSAIRARLFNGAGVPFGADFVVNTTTEGEQLTPHVAALTGGRFVVSWTDYSRTGADTDGYAVRAQVFNADGSRSGSELVISTTTANDQIEPLFSALPDGRFVAVWVNVVAGYGSMRGQVFDHDGSKAGEEFSVTTHDFTNIHPPAIATLPDGRFVVSFVNDNPQHGDGSATGIFAQIFDPRVAPVHLAGTALDDQYVGTRFDDVIQGGLGKDRISGGEGNDFLVGGAGADILDGGAGADTASYADSAQRVIVSLDGSLGANAGGDAKDDTLTNIENLTGSLHDDIMVGDARDNVLSGLAGADILKGGGGSDLLVGGSGNDGLSGGDGDDTAAYGGNFDQYQITLADQDFTFGVSGAEGDDELVGIEHLQFNDGRIDIADGNALFDTLYYMLHNRDVYRAGGNALAHYDAHGWREGRDPNPLFDTSGYLAVNPDVAAAGINPLDHYRQSGWRDGRDPSAWFDTAVYLARNPDVAAAGIDPLEHYFAFGRSEGRKAFAAIGALADGFDAQHYLFQNPDVAAAGVDPREHFDVFGWREGRDPNAWFDTAGYLAHYADVAASGVNPLEHYRAFGWREGRDPSYAFDTSRYLAANPDVAAADVDPLEHFLQFGIYEGRNAYDGGWL